MFYGGGPSSVGANESLSGDRTLGRPAARWIDRRQGVYVQMWIEILDGYLIYRCSTLHCMCRGKTRKTSHSSFACTLYYLILVRQNLGPLRRTGGNHIN